MKTVRGTVVERIEVIEQTWAIDAFCDECMKDEEVRDRPEPACIDATYERATPGAEVGVARREKIRSRIVTTMDGKSEITGYRCRGCDRRLDLDLK